MSTIDDLQAHSLTDNIAASRFPPDFLWGGSTSSYQVEGATHEDGRGISIWDRFCTVPGAVVGGENGDVAVDHYHRVPQDIALMKELGFSAYCFSIAWPRILPADNGVVNDKGLDFYDRLIDSLLEQGITPYAKLYHWDLPQYLQDKGGWVNRDTAFEFADYAEVVAQRLGDRVNNWLTLNEPWCSAFLGYGIGIHAPGICDRQQAIQAGHHLLLAHGLAMPLLRAKTLPDARLGIALNLYPVYAADDRPETQQAVQWMDAFKNRWFLDPIFYGRYPENFFAEFGVTPPIMQDDDMAIISTPIDVLGINFYSRSVVRVRTPEERATNSKHSGVQATSAADAYEEVPVIPGSAYTDMNWEVYPQGLTDILVRVHKDYAPASMVITENGAAYNDQWHGDDVVHDPERKEYLRAHVAAVADAVAQGAPMKGYFAWSFMDNFEWAEGYGKRFGMVYVDYPTQRRIVKDSGRWYAAFLHSGGTLPLR